MEISCVDELLHNIRAEIEHAHLLQAPIATAFLSDKHKEDLEETLASKMRTMTLELTEKCNLRCEYCIYNETYTGNRNFASGEMNTETVTAAIDMLSKHSGEEVSLTFYGGEPLLRFDLIKYAVEYAQKLMPEKKISFSITTNLTLMTKEIAEFVAAIDRFSIVCSIDGPEHIHDQYRKYPNGNGSFHDAMRGLKYLVEAIEHDQLTAKLYFSMVLASPYTSEKISDIQVFFDSLDWLPSDITKSISYTTPGSEKVHYEMADSDEVTFKPNPLLEWIESDKIKSADTQELFTKRFSDDILLTIHKRAYYDEPIQPRGFNGCCVPGVERIYVCSNGDLLPCERIGTCPTIGNVFSGHDIQRIRDLYINEYEEKSIHECSECWAYKICRVCYSRICTKDSIDMNLKNRECRVARDSALKALIYYHSVLESDPESIAYLNNYVSV